jgi:hypothetical protein
MLTALLTGCSGNFDPMAGTKPPETALGTITGIVHGGHQPDIGAAVYVYQAGVAGYKSASKSLLGSYTTGNWPTTQDGNGNYYVTTNAQGSFNISGEYTCTSGAQVYIYVLGGNTGGGSPNPNAGFLAVLGQCPASGTLSGTIGNVYINEVSTIAAAYALAGYAADATHIGGPATTDTLGQTGIANAFLEANNLFDVQTGYGSVVVAPTTTPGGNGTVPQLEIDALANSLAACVNTTGASTTAPNACNTLLGDALSGGTTGTKPTDTATAAINIAHNPTANVSAIFGLGAATGTPYVPALTTGPTDWTITLTYSSSFFDTIAGMAVDSTGSVWQSNSADGEITAVNNQGVVTEAFYAVSGSTNYWAGASGMAVDESGNYWFNAPGYKDSVDEFSPGAGSFNYIAYNVQPDPTLIAIDGNGDFYTPAHNTSGSKEYMYWSTDNVADFWDISLGTTYMNDGYAVAVDSNNVSWITSDNTTNTTNTLLLYFTSPNNTSGSVSGGVCSGTGNTYVQGTGVAIDHSNNVWISDGYTGDLVKFLNSCVYSVAYSVGTKLNGVAIDGASNIFSITGTNGLVKLSNAGTLLSETGGYVTGVTGTLGFPVVDGSGNVWFSSSNNTVSETVGIATPVVTPIAAGVAGNTLGYTP